ncbi:MAG: hypothetical protein R6V58_16690 [Planctomycetota bacterium]
MMNERERERVKENEMRTAGRLVLLLGLAAALGGCVGASKKRPVVSVLLSVNQETFKVGEPVIATVLVENRSSARVVLRRFDGKTAEFICSGKGTHKRQYREPVQSKTVAAAAHEIGPGGSSSRAFLFTRLTEQPGEYALLSQVKGVVVDDELLAHAVFSEPAEFRVTDEVWVRRDPHSGLILEKEAVRLAEESASGEVVKTKALLARMGDSGLYMWLVRVREKRPGGGERIYTVKVNPYLGRVSRFGEPALEKAGGAGEPRSKADKSSGTSGRPGLRRSAGSVKRGGCRSRVVSDEVAGGPGGPCNGSDRSGPAAGLCVALLKGGATWCSGVQ